MYEVRIVEEILDKLRRICSQRNAKISRARLLIGELNRPNEVEKWLKKSSEAEFQSTEFEVIKSPTRISCECGYSGKIKSAVSISRDDAELKISCPRCGNKGIKLTGGLEKEVLDYELERSSDG